MRKIYEIALDIREEWQRTCEGPGMVMIDEKAIDYESQSFLKKMYQLRDKNSTFGYEKASVIVENFLAFSDAFQGERAIQLKNELREIIK